MSAKKVSVSLIMPVEVREKIREIAGKLSLDSEAQVYR